MLSDDKYNEIVESQEFSFTIKTKLAHLRRLLHEGKASVMVGAGFSKNAEKDTNVRVKDWNELSYDFFRKLYGKEPENKDLILKSPLRLASQVKCQFGRPELNSIIENAVPNNKIKPGPLHSLLVNLPWKDIYTTNYDTLIEDAKSRIPYKVVTNKQTLLYTLSPRIIKLHGSFPNADYIIDEEDYRQYPDTHPEFVNTVRQSLIESSLCLVGFSGDDPNFLNWIGWIRDKMGDDIAPIYLFDVSDNGLHESEISLFKQQRKINVIPIMSSFKNDIPGYFEFVFRYLGKKPENLENKWSAKISYDEISKVSGIKFEGNSFSTPIDEENLKELISKYRNIRYSYPGWLFMPLHHLEESFEESFRYELDKLIPVLKKITGVLKYRLACELDWRIRMSFIPHSLLPNYVSIIEVLIEEIDSNQLLKDAQLTSLAISVLSSYRQKLQFDKFDELSKKLNSVVNTSDTDNIRRYYYENALCAVNQLNYEKVHQILAIWSPALSDYLGNLWKSVILCEVGQFNEAYVLLVKTRQQIQNEALGAISINLADSALSVFDSIISVYESLQNRRTMSNREQSNFRIYEYFRHEKAQLQNQREKNLNSDKAKTRTHDFNLNHVVNHFSVTRAMRESEARFAGRVLMIWESFGYPFALGFMSLDSSLMQITCDSLFSSGNVELALIALMRSYQKDTIKAVLTKERIMNIEDHLLNIIFDNITSRAGIVLDWDSRESYHYKMSILVTQIARKFVVAIDKERIKLLLPILIRIRDSHSRDFKNEYFKTVFDCLTIDDFVDIVPVLAKASIECEERQSEIPFPDDMPKTIILDDEVVKIIERAFRNDVTDKGLSAYIRNAAYLRTANLYRLFNDKQKDIIDSLIVDWRNNHRKDSVNTLYSFNLLNKGRNDNLDPTELTSIAIEDIEKSLQPKDFDNNATESEIVRYTDREEYSLSSLLALSQFIENDKIPQLVRLLDLKLIQEMDFYKNERSEFVTIFDNSHEPNIRAISSILFRIELSEVDKELSDSLLRKYISLMECDAPYFYIIDKLNCISNFLTNEEFTKFLKKMVKYMTKI